MPRVQAIAPHYRRPLLSSPFFECYKDYIETDSYLYWAGYSTVDVFSSVEQEYFSIRNTASVFDLTPMVKYHIVGADAAAFMSRLVTRNISKLKTDRVGYTIWCDDAGNIIDDGTVFRLGENEFRLCSAERQLDWLLYSAVGFDVKIEEITQDVAALAVQGPTSCSILKRLGLTGVENLKPFEIGHYNALGIAIMASRTGFTGDLGYELWIAPEDARVLWDGLMAAGQSRGIRPIGYQALDMARIEAGFILPEVEFVSAESTIRLDRERSPFELGLDWCVDMEKGNFTGRRALLQKLKEGPKRKLVGLEIDGNKSAHDALIYDCQDSKKQIGTVTSALWSPTCKRNLALAMLEAPYFDNSAKGYKGELWAEIYLQRELVWQRRMARCRIVERPFYLPDRKKNTPPADR